MVYARSAIVGVEVYKGSNSVDSLKKEKNIHMSGEETQPFVTFKSSGAPPILTTKPFESTSTASQN